VPEAGAHELEVFAIAVVTLDGRIYRAGDCDARFALQSLSKVFAYGLALEDHGRDEVLKHVGVEPSGERFNAIEFDDDNNRPYNPMVNAGALVTTSLVAGRDNGEKLERILGALRHYAGNDELAVDQHTFEAEIGAADDQNPADRNRATAYLMRSLDMIDGDVEGALELYLKQCSVLVDCSELAVMAATLANGGANPVTGDSCLPRARVRDVLSVMHTCGMYDAAGEWAYEVGVPAKSGVSGGIMCVVPGKGGVGVYSPGLDYHGNSVRGVRVCQDLSARLGLHVFATEEEDALLGGAPEE
jgi:glutaminase